MPELSKNFIEGVNRALKNEGGERSIEDITKYLAGSASFINPLLKTEWDSYSPEERSTNIKTALNRLRGEDKVEQVDDKHYRARESW